MIIVETDILVDAGRWPEDFFEPDISSSNLRMLKEGVAEMEDAIMRMRKNQTDIEVR